MRETAASARGVLYPAQLPTFHREAAAADLAALVRWFWIPEWNVEPGRASRQHLIGFPACNLVVEDSMSGISGPSTRSSYRDLTGRGWAVGALLRPAAARSLVGDVSALRDSYLNVDYPELSAPVREAMNGDASPGERRRKAVAAFSRWLRLQLGAPNEEGLLANRIVEVAETNSALLTAADLAAHVHISPRTLQRLTAKYVGLSPAALIRRRRLQEAAERLRDDPSLDLTVLAHSVGYADHAHLTNDFRVVLGITPSTYRQASHTA